MSALARSQMVGIKADLFASMYYSNVHTQDRTRSLFAGMTAKESYVTHKQTHLRAALSELRHAVVTHNETARAHWRHVVDQCRRELNDARGISA